MSSFKTYSTITEEELVARLRGRDTAALSLLYDRYSAALYGVISKVIRTDEAAEDVLQETFVKIWNSFTSYDPSKGKLFTWMLNIARNLAIDKVRSKDFKNSKKNQSLDDIVHVVDESNSVSFNPDQIGLKEIVGKLEPEYFRIVDLIYFKGYTHVEASEELAIPLGTIKTRLRAAISSLRQHFSEVD
ncbi:MAG: sigma-70 family RNA polymerase sigma factor [Bacteroidota bacterium]